ncbi:hypothetical protein [Nocardia nova]|uniref:hypothetical protein n=1 Tax=Nocardia nova TaxID=37330 RepID=UPI0011B096F1|nr:hypothetical protein [Nocardia nova]
MALAEKLNRLFALGHERDQPERTTDDVARALSQRIGRVVDPSIIEGARAGLTHELPVEVAEALCVEFGVYDSSYLLAENSPEIEVIDLRLQIWILIRDLGLQHFATRGHQLDADSLRQIIALLQEYDPSRASARSPAWSADA